jgi:hypothetical protein
MHQIKYQARSASRGRRHGARRPCGASADIPWALPFSDDVEGET